MEVKRFTFGEYAVSIRPETWRVEQTRAKYASIIKKARHPELGSYNPLTAYNEGGYDPETWTLNAIVTQFCTALAQAYGRTVPVPIAAFAGEVLDKEAVLKAYDHAVDDETGFWKTLVEAVYLANVPEQPVVERSEERLTPEERADPN